MKKIIATLIAMAVVICMSPTAFSATEVAGTFTPVPTGVAISCNNTSPAFSNIDLGASGEIKWFNITNDGDTNCTVVTTAQDGVGTWDLVAGTSAPATSNEYCINVNPNGTGYVDAQTEKTIASDIPPSGIESGDGTWHNVTKFDLKVFISDYTSEGTPGEQVFFVNLTASAIS